MRTKILDKYTPDDPANVNTNNPAYFEVFGGGDAEMELWGLKTSLEKMGYQVEPLPELNQLKLTVKEFILDEEDAAYLKHLNESLISTGRQL
jgi:hypothetical protein